MWWKHLLFTSRVIKGINGNNRGEHGRLIGTMVIHTSIVSIAEPKTPKKNAIVSNLPFCAKYSEADQESLFKI